MKVLHLINSLNTGGAEKLILETLPMYNKKDLQIDLLLLNGTQHPFLNQLKEKKCCNVFFLNKGSVYNPFHIFKIIPFLKQYDIIHAHLFPSLYWLAFAKKISFSGVKIIFTEHNTTNNRRNNFILKIVDKFVYKLYNRIITISDDVNNNIKQHLKLNESKFVLIKNGIDTKHIFSAVSLTKSDFFEDEDTIIIQVSSFTKQKDQPTLIKTLKHLPKKYKLLLVGTGPLLQYNKNLVNELHLSERVSFLGVRTDVPRLLKTADVIILSSHHEGLSLSSIEAMASGKPFIASNVPGLTEIVKDAGVLFEKENENELSKIILQLIDNKTYYNKIVKQCLLRAKQYDIQFMIEKHIELYNNIVNSEK